MRGFDPPVPVEVERVGGAAGGAPAAGKTVVSYCQFGVPEPPG